MEKVDIKSMTLPCLTEFMAQYGQPAYKAKQLFSFMHKGAEGFDEITTFKKDFREKLSNDAFIDVLKTERRLISKIDGTNKFLFSLSDGHKIESVVMKYKYGNSICISSQVGCQMGCVFCASGIAGFVRNLTPAEMLNQIIFARKEMGEPITRIVLMGIGEPLMNYDNLISFLEIVNDPEGLNISHRNISVSTCGIVPKIMDLADKKLQLTLSVSLHAPNDSIRNTIMPVSRKYDMDTLMDSCKYYIKKTGRRISFEYTLINGLNDSDDCAAELARLLKGVLCHVNLIPVNSVSERSFVKSSADRAKSFQNILINKGINATIRRTLGADINASCGQLRRENEKEV